MNRHQCLLVATLACLCVQAMAADNVVPSRHQLMKECMAKQKEADSGRNHDEMKAFCADWAKTQRDAAKTAAAKN